MNHFLNNYVKNYGVKNSNLIFHLIKNKKLQLSYNNRNKEMKRKLKNFLILKLLLIKDNSYQNVAE